MHVKSIFLHPHQWTQNRACLLGVVLPWGGSGSMGSVLYSKSLYGGRGIAGRLGFPVHEEEEEGGANVDAPFFLVCLRSEIPLPEEVLLDLLPILYT